MNPYQEGQKPDALDIAIGVVVLLLMCVLVYAFGTAMDRGYFPVR
ncbi:MAG: hypothetical protein ACR652_24450 [Methylocystis sp.]